MKFLEEKIAEDDEGQAIGGKTDSLFRSGSEFTSRLPSYADLGNLGGRRAVGPVILEGGRWHCGGRQRGI